MRFVRDRCAARSAGRPARRAAVVLCAIVLGGCNSWQFNVPPTAVDDRPLVVRDQQRKRVVVMGPFENPPASPLAWEDIGAGMSDALARTLVNRGNFEVWIDPPLVAEAEKLIMMPTRQRQAALARIRSEHPEVQFILTGIVTDFCHSTDKPREVRRRSWFGTKREAIVALSMNIVDLERGRVVVADHLYGAHDAPPKKTQDLYASMAFGTYLFWNSPLGYASEEAIDKAKAALDTLVPTSDDSIRIVSEINDRRVQISGGSEKSHQAENLYYVCTVDASGELDVVHDPDSGLPLRARIESSGRIATTAGLIGRKPERVDLRGAVLTTRPGPAALADADRNGDATN